MGELTLAPPPRSRHFEEYQIFKIGTQPPLWNSSKAFSRIANQQDGYLTWNDVLLRSSPEPNSTESKPFTQCMYHESFRPPPHVPNDALAVVKFFGFQLTFLIFSFFFKPWAFSRISTSRDPLNNNGGPRLRIQINRKTTSCLSFFKTWCNYKIWITTVPFWTYTYCT